MEDYTGLGAIAWDLFSSDDVAPDVAFFQKFVEQGGGLALDVGCANGRLLVPFLKAGLQVEGVEPSGDLIAICRQNAAKFSLNPVLYQQVVEELDLPHRYRTIFIPCGTIQLVNTREKAFEALRRCYNLLEPGGTLVITVFNRWDELKHEKVGEWQFRARKPLPDGSEIEKHAMTESVNWVEQSLAVKVRYRRYVGEEIVEEQIVSAPERWYFKYEMLMMLENTGFKVRRVTGNYSEAEFTDEHYVMALIATK